MSNLHDLHAAIDHRFGVRNGVRVVNDVLVEYPGDMPSSEDQAKWIAEYETARSWSELRAERNRRLAECDWWASSDLTMTDEQKAYRVALRNLPANTSDPANPSWPSKP